MAINGLEWDKKLVDANGYPTLEFQILWNSLKQLLDDLEERLAALEGA
jgi:hypothetical protein